MALVSIIIPVYNAEEYLEKSLDSVINQTLTNIEIILIDDGSTDGSLAILRKYASIDSRIKLLHEENKGAGAARNYGMKYATGEYLSFLDCDDIVEKNMIEEMWRISETNNLDVIVCRSDQFHCVTHKVDSCPWTIKTNLLPEKKVFSSHDIKKEFFDLFIWWPWDKLFRKSFVDKLHLQFQELRTTNDLFFVSVAVLEAARVSYTNKILIHHRVDDKKSLSNTREKSWDNFLFALDALEKFLKVKGLYNRFKQDFINYVLSFSLWHLETLHGSSVGLLYNALRDKWYLKFGVLSEDKEYFYNEDYYEKLNTLMNLDLNQYLIQRLDFANNQANELQDTVRTISDEKNKLVEINKKLNSEIIVLRQNIDGLQKECETTKKNNEKLIHSKSFLIGQKITYLPRLIWKLFK